MSNVVRALVLGAGSIGLRHLKNLRALGVAELAFVEPASTRREEVSKEVSGARGFESMEEAFAFHPNVAIVATPSDQHVAQALVLARQGFDLFIEKPLAINPTDLRTLVNEIEGRHLVSLVGCNMRFHPGPRKVHALLREGAVGRPHFARIQCGSYLPEWRPTQDYRKSYSANANAGGGVILDCIHEIDLARWYLGPVTDVMGVAKHVSALELDVEDLAMLVFSHHSGALSNIHLDYIQRSYDRGCHIAGERGTITWDFKRGTVRHYNAETKTWSEFSEPAGFQTNDMYVDEMSHFLECAHTRAATTLPVADAVEVMALAFASRRACAEGTSVKL